MMEVDHLIEHIRSYNPKVNEDLIKKAYYYTKEKHKNQKRASGEPFFCHPLAVANILAQMHFDETTIAVGLLHDTIEDTNATREEIENIFGKEFSYLVEGLTKLNRLDNYSQKAIQGENLRKFLVATSKDVRILLVKLADRLHNMRTLDAFPPEKRIRISQETMDLYAPLSARIGMCDMSEELQDLAFRYLNFEAYTTITERLKYLLRTNENLLKIIEDEISLLFKESHLKARVFSRQKRPYAVFFKMKNKSLAFEQLSDIFGFRVIVDSIKDCYRALGLIHTNWSVIPGKFKDYISLPKPNDYRSIHTSVIGPESQRIELQIRTNEMHEIAEYGLAAHPLYKEIGSRSSASLLNELNAYAWIRKTLQILMEGGNPEEFLEHTKLELFQDQVFCFTPKGKLVTLPKDATPVDFAYEIHTDIGNSCIGAKINGQSMPLLFPLRNGDEVEIITSNTKTPVEAWANLVKTGKAKAAIRRATREATYEQYCLAGQDILTHYFEICGKQFNEKDLVPILARLNYEKIKDLYVSIGKHEQKAEDVLKIIYPNGENLNQDFDEKNETLPDSCVFFRDEASPFSFNYSQECIKKYISPIDKKYNYCTISFCENGAIPGDSIIGFLNNKNHITVYPARSQTLLKYEHRDKRWIEMRWNFYKIKDNLIENPQHFAVKISVFLRADIGALARMTAILAEQNANILYLNVPYQPRGHSELIFVIEVEDDKHLEKIFKKMQETKVVSLVKRIYG